MKLKKNFANAVDAIRVALKSAIDDPNFNQNDLSEVWRHYLGMKAISERVTEEDTIKLSYEDIVKGYDPDVNVYAAGPVDLDQGRDIISFS